jgi:hypothetical protein
MQAYASIIKPNAAADWVFRLSVVAAIPTGDRQKKVQHLTEYRGTACSDFVTLFA